MAAILHKTQFLSGGVHLHPMWDPGCIALPRVINSGFFCVWFLFYVMRISYGYHLYHVFQSVLKAWSTEYFYLALCLNLHWNYLHCTAANSNSSPKSFIIKQLFFLPGCYFHVRNTHGKMNARCVSPWVMASLWTQSDQEMCPLFSCTCCCTTNKIIQCFIK